MKNARLASLVSLASLSLAAHVFFAPSLAQAQAAAKPTPEAVRDAGKHFQRGVALFNEADYAGALAEFKRAYEIAPNAAVLYNIGQTHFQLRAYAAALSTFERYVAEAPAHAEHRDDANAAIETLKSRVGKIDIVVVPDGAEVTIDDEVAGKTPMPPVLAAVGRRKVSVFKDGAQQVRFVEVSAGETVKVEIRLADSSGGAAAGGALGSTTMPPAEPRSTDMTVPTILWVGTGALAAGAIVTGILASGASSDLSDERAKKDGSTTRAKLDDLESKTSTLALVTDILIGAAVVTGGFALYTTLSAKPSKSGALSPPAKSPPRAGANFWFGATSAGVEGRF